MSKLGKGMNNFFVNCIFFGRRCIIEKNILSVSHTYETVKDDTGTARVKYLFSCCAGKTEAVENPDHGHDSDHFRSVPGRPRPRHGLRRRWSRLLLVWRGKQFSTKRQETLKPNGCLNAHIGYLAYAGHISGLVLYDRPKCICCAVCMQYLSQNDIVQDHLSHALVRAFCGPKVAYPYK